MSTTVPTFSSAPSTTSARRGRVLAMMLAVSMALVGLVALGAGPAAAGPVDQPWTTTSPGATTVSNGSLSAASMSYDVNPAGVGVTRSWDFTTIATPTSAGSAITVPYTWEGLHAWFQVTTRLDMIVNGAVVGTLVNDGPVICCTAPSNGFTYGGVATFNVAAGQTYGFRISGSNSDFNNFLRGTLTLSTKAYVDPTVGTDNRDWRGATTLPPAGITGTLDEPGEARWFKFPVVPGEQARVDLSQLPADYDVALYGDIQAAFDELLASDEDVTQLAAASAAGAPGSETQVPVYPASVQNAPETLAELPSTQFAPRIYAPRIYAPRIYAPRIYAPRIYAPRIYAPRIYAPDSYAPGLESDADFRDAFSAAQNQTLLAVSANTGSLAETVSASTGNTEGYFYVRVQGHDDLVFDANERFRLDRSVTGGAECVGLDDFGNLSTLTPSRGNAATVIVTDTNKLGLAAGSTARAAYLTSLGNLAGATDGAVVNVADSARVQALQTQVAGHSTCPYATNLVANAVKDIVDSYRNAQSKYVVIAGGDDVIPFFRYPDTSGLGQESQFEPPLMPNTPAGASLTKDQVLSQDAYGSATEVTIGGSTVPVPDLAVGRLVKTPAEIQSTIVNYLALDNSTGTRTLPAPTRSLVTGYDFLADAATAVNQEFVAALPGGTHDTLINNTWNATQLEQALLGSRHDLVYLAGHFSANDTLAADFTTTFDAETLGLAANADKLKNTLVLSAGCHSGYNIVDGAATGTTNPFDWTQRMAQQHAVLIGGTGYQYGDTDFLEYSERLYLDVARRLHEGPATGDSAPLTVGTALALAKQDYLASLSTLTGMDQKVVLQATLYGLPMTGFDAPGRRPVGGAGSQVTPEAVTSGPGETLGLATASLDDVATPTGRGTKASGAGAGLPSQLSWLNGADGVTVQPGAPAVPKQIKDVTVPGQVLRGVGFRGGDYTDTSGLLPLTGAPAIEGATAHTTFESDAFFPQRLATANYFGALGASGRTSLVLTPAQYRSDAPGVLTNTERAYSDLDLRLFYSGEDSTTYGTNQPAHAAAPSIGAVRGKVKDGVVTFSARVTGDPSAGVQQVWVTWTGSGADSGHGRWESVDLTQEPADSTLWTGTLPLPGGQSSQGLRFLVQAANGIGAVGLDTAEGDGYRVTIDQPAISLIAHAPSTSSPLGVTAHVGDQGYPLAGRAVRFTVTQGSTIVFTNMATSDGNGRAELTLPTGASVPLGSFHVLAELLDASGAVISTDSLETAVTPEVSINDVLVNEGNSGTTTATFTVRLSEASSDTVTVGYGTSPGTATAEADYVTTSGSLSFAPGVTEKSVTVPVVGETIYEPDETLILELSQAHGARLVDASGQLTIRNDDVLFAFGGFQAPVDPLPTVNRVKAGQSVPVKFSLGGNRGLNIFAAGSPSTKEVNCSTSAVIDEVETTTAGSSALTYDASKDTYTYVWKTSKDWTGNCRTLVLTFTDGRTYTAGFTFK